MRKKNMAKALAMEVLTCCCFSHQFIQSSLEYTLKNTLKLASVTAAIARSFVLTTYRCLT